MLTAQLYKYWVYINTTNQKIMSSSQVMEY